MRRSFSVLASFGTLRRYLQNETTRSVTAKSGILFGASAATLGSAVVYTSTKPCAFASAVKTESQRQQWSGTVSPYGLPPIALYQYEVCPFCCKVRAFLDYHQIPYEVIEVNPVSKGELKWSTYKKVPVMKLGDVQVNDSNTIISTLAEELKSSSKTDSMLSQWKGGTDHPPLAADGSPDEAKWRQWVDDRFVRILTANIYRSLNESWETFEYIAEHGNFGMASRYATRLFGTATMYVIGRRMPAKYDIEGNLREALYSAVEDWMTAVGSKDFLGGRKPNLADLAVYGVIEAVHGTRTYQDMMKNTKVGDWHERMTSVVGTSSRLNLLSPTTKPAQSHLET